MNISKIEIVDAAIINLENNTGIIAKWYDEPGENYDGTIELIFGDGSIRFETEIKKELREHQMASIITKAKALPNLMICAARIYPKLKKTLREHNIAWLEWSGNIYVNTRGRMLWIETKKPLPTKEKKLNRAFTKKGLQVVFHLLNDQTLIEENYRAIAVKTNTSLGNVSNVFNGLKASGFIVRKNNKEKALVNKKELLDKWVTAYQDILKPAISFGKYRFADQGKYSDWKNIRLNAPAAQWGGEPAAELFTGQLRPAEFTIYTNETMPELMKNYRLLPDEDGDVVVYKKFWDVQQDENNIAPPLLVYADLMLKEEKRCRETAQLIYEKYLEKQF